MDCSIEKNLSNFVRVWQILVPTLVLVRLGMVVFSWPDKWLAWLLLLLALIFGVLALKHTEMARRALHLVKHGQPEECLVEIRRESGDDRDYFKGIVSRQKSGEKWDVLFTPHFGTLLPLYREPYVQKPILNQGPSIP